MIQITGSISLAPIGVQNRLYLRQFVTATRFGPGLDWKQDEAMFMYMDMILPSEHNIVLYYDKDNMKAGSTRVKQIFNRLYFGQFEELGHLKGWNFDQGDSVQQSISIYRQSR